MFDRKRLQACFAGLLALWTSTATNAADANIICPGNPKLAALAGTWLRADLLGQLRQSRSWSATMSRDSESTQTATVYVSADRVDFSLNWHEGDSGDVCVRQDPAGLWAKRPDVSAWSGPYVRTQARNPAEEAAAYLATFFAGCFRSDRGERWCLSPQQITMNGRQIKAELQMDLSEGPLYGTAFKTTLGPLPFTVFVPAATGWEVFQDDWASNPTRKPLDPSKDRPWRRLKPE
jgi:hypothetical protein